MVEEEEKETGGGAGEDSFIFRPAMGRSTNSNLFLGRRKCRLVGEVQVGEENTTIRKLAVHSDPLYHRITEILHMSLLPYKHDDTSLEYASCGI